MTFEKKLKKAQAGLMEQGIDGWLLYDYHGSNPLARSFLEISPSKMTTRRFFYWIPQEGEPVKIVPLIEPYTLDHLPGVKWTYKGWQDLEKRLFSLSAENRVVAMEYSPCNALPSLSKVDAGTVELIKKGGAQIVSSAALLQHFASIWTAEQQKSHFAAAAVLEDIAGRTWAFIETSLKHRSPINEFGVQQFMLQAMEEAGCETEDPPICAVNAHSADPHYYPTPMRFSRIAEGDFILLDLWCKQKIPHAVYADITRAGVAAARPAAKQNEIFKIVREARGCATALIQEHFENRKPLQGWQVDEACRGVIEKAGYGEFFIHRTGHHIGEEVHGPGANLDNLETHDERLLLPCTGFSVEPGIYLPGEFGIRLEYDICIDEAGCVHITGGIQKELLVFN